MATKLTKPVTRETTRKVGRLPIILTIAPNGSQNEALLGLRLKGRRTQYVVALSSVYQMAALWHGQKEARARREARRNGIPWRTARRQFQRDNSIQTPLP
jgi:hypothetical protein